MRLLITGGAGFIGSHYVRTMLATDDIEQITVLDKFTYSGNRANLREFHDDPRFRLIEGDICDRETVDACLPGHTMVVHFAAESHVDRSIQSSAPFFMTNVLGTQNLLESSLKSGVQTFVHVSTDEVYGSIDSGSWDEDEPLLPNSPYAASKAGSDLVARAFHKTHGLDVRITRCSNNFGTHQYPEKMIPLFVTNLIDGLKVPLYGDGMNVRDWLHVEDHCRGVQLVAKSGRPGEIYNIGGGTELTNHQLTLKLLALFERGEDTIESVEDRKGHDRRYSVDWSKIQRELGYHPTRSLDNDLEGIVRWYRDNEDWWRPLKRK